jgi:hypothetical protein
MTITIPALKPGSAASPFGLFRRREEYLSAPTPTDQVIYHVGKELPGADIDILSLNGEIV